MLPTPATLINSGAIPPLLGCLVIGLAFAIYRKRVRHQEWSTLAGDLLVLGSTAAICAVTLFRNEGAPSFSANISWAPDGLNRFVEGLGNDSEITLNILLFIPAAAIITWRYRRPLVTILALTLLSLTIELTQGLVGLGNADSSDLISNISGILIGTLITGGILCLTHRRNTQTIWTEVALIALLLISIGGTFPLANWRQNHVEHELRSKFDRTTVANYNHWDTTGELPDKVFRLGHTFSDGATVDTAQATVRFPTNTLGIRRCVMATWTTQGFTVQEQSGAPCKIFIG